MIKFTEYIVNNSITNTLSDDKFDVGSPFNFIEYLNYVKVIDTNDLENFNQYKKYLEKWKETDFDNNKNNAVNIRSIYLNFFNDLTLTDGNESVRNSAKNSGINSDQRVTATPQFNTIKSGITVDDTYAESLSSGDAVGTGTGNTYTGNTSADQPIGPAR